MSRLDEFLANETAIRSIVGDAIKSPDMPVGSAVQEAENLKEYALQDLNTLAKVGITEEQIKHLEPSAGALSYAQSQWAMIGKLPKIHSEAWKLKAQPAYELIDTLCDDLRFGFRKHPALLQRLKEIEEGTGHEDMIQDLVDLTTLAKEHLDLLSLITFDEGKLEDAKTMSEELPSLLAKFNGEKLADNEARVLRDQAYTYLKLQVTEIREAGKYLFKKDKKRFIHYISMYSRNKNIRNNVVKGE